MPFDPINWGCAFLLTQVSTRLLARPNDLRTRLQGEAAEWAKTLPEHLGVNHEHIFGETREPPSPHARVARRRLQEVLQDGVVPSESQWCDAFLEHWKAKREELGPDGNAFFQQSEDDARHHLSALSHRIHHCCEADPDLAHRTIARQLGELLRTRQLPEYALELRPAAQTLLLERPHSWPSRLFAAVLADEIERHSSLLRDYRNGLSWGAPVRLRPAEFAEWIRPQISQLEQLVDNLHRLFAALPAALGPSASDSSGNTAEADASAIVDIARKSGQVYRCFLEWALDKRRVCVASPLDGALRACERFVEDPIRQIREFSQTLCSEVQAVLDDDSAETRCINLTLTLTMADDAVQEYGRIMDAITSGRMRIEDD